MAVQCPPIEWPTSLEECGPIEDPSILLIAGARIGDTPVTVAAIRIDRELRRAPDFKPDIAPSAYKTAAFETILEELECLTEELNSAKSGAQRSIIELKTGSYVMWVLSALQDA